MEVSQRQKWNLHFGFYKRTLDWMNRSWLKEHNQSYFFVSCLRRHLNVLKCELSKFRQFQSFLLRNFSRLKMILCSEIWFLVRHISEIAVLLRKEVRSILSKRESRVLSNSETHFSVSKKMLFLSKMRGSQKFRCPIFVLRNYFCWKSQKIKLRFEMWGNSMKYFQNSSEKLFSDK